jgi:hypothetical protein
VHCFELLEIELLKTGESVVFTSMKAVGENRHTLYRNVIENVFMIVIDPVFRSEHYTSEKPYQKNKFTLVFDSFLEGKEDPQ